MASLHHRHQGKRARRAQMRPDQKAALVEIAEQRREAGRPPPVSEVVRELLHAALKRWK